MPGLRFIPSALAVLLGLVMLVIPWLLPGGHGHGKAIVFAVAGAAELVLGAALTYLIHHQPSDGRRVGGPSAPR